MTLLEVFAIVMVIVILFAALLLFMAAHGKAYEKARRISCVNNLKQIALATGLYLNDHQGLMPWQVSAANGGSLQFVNSSNLFEHFRVMSNELNTPKILACASDSDRIRATDFAQMANTNMSYFICLDAISNAPARLLAGDRNVSGGVLSNGFMRTFARGSSASWTNELHEREGNVALVDGSAQQLTSARLSTVVSNSFGTNRFIRLAIP